MELTAHVKPRRLPAVVLWGAGATILVLLAAAIGLRFQVDGIALFWPAAGIAAGLILVTRGADRQAVVAGTLIALVIGNASQGRSVATSIVFMSGNLAQAYLIAYGLERVLGAPMRLDSLRNAGTLIIAAVAAPVIIGLPVAAGLVWAGHSQGSLSQLWWSWIGAHALGIVATAPMVLLLTDAVRNLQRRRDYPFSVLVSAAMLTTLMPLVLLGAYAIGSWSEQQRADEMRIVARTAAALSDTVDRELRAMVRKVELLAGAHQLRGDDPAEADARLRQAATLLNGQLVLVDRSYAQVINTLAPPGKPLPRTSNPDVYKVVFEAGQSRIGNLITGTVSRTTRFTVSAPVSIDGEVRYVLKFAPNENAVLDVVRTFSLPEGWFAAVADASNRRVARSQHHEKFYGTSLGPEFIASLTAPFGVVRSRDLEGRDSVTAHHSSDLTGWRSIVWAPQANFDAPTSAAQQFIAALIAATLTISLGVAWLAGRALAAPTQHLVAAARALATGPVSGFQPGMMREANMIGASLLEASQQRSSIEAARDEARRFAEGLVQTAPMLLYIYDLTERRNVYIGPQIGSVLGYTAAEIAERGDGLLTDLAHPDDLGRIGAHHARIVEGKASGPFEIEYRMRAKDGRWLWLSSCETVHLRDADGRARQILGTAQNITPRKHSEEVLRESERQLSAVLRALPIGMALVDRKGRTLVANDVYRRFVPEIVPSHNEARHQLWVGQHADGSTIAREHFPAARALRGEHVWPGQEFRYHGDEIRGPFWTRIAALPLTDDAGAVEGATVVIADIDAQKRAELAVRESEERLGAALRAGRLGVYYDPRTHRVTWDATVYRLWGVREGEPVSYDTWEAAVHPDDVARVRQAFCRALEPDGGGRYDLEFRIFDRSDNSLRWVNTEADVTFENGKPIRLVGTVQDITASKEAQQRMAAIRDALSAEAPPEAALQALVEDRSFAEKTATAADRRAALVASGLLDCAPEPAFDQITRLAAGILQAPLSLLTVIDEHRQFFVSSYGVAEPVRSARQKPLWTSYCRCVIEGEAPVSIHDAEHNPMVAEIGAWKDGFVAYLATPVRDREGRVVASLCVADSKVRAWTRRDLLTLEGIARLLMRELENRAILRDLKQSESDLDAQRRLHKSVTDNTNTALFIMDERQQCVFMNPAAEAMTGYTLAETRDRPLHDVLHHTRPDGRPYPLSECPIDQALPKNDREQGEEVFVHKDGRFYPVAFTASPIRDASRVPIGTVIEVQDITERKQAEQALLQRNRQLDLLASAAEMLLATPDDAMAALEAIFGRVADLLGVESFFHYRPAATPRLLELSLTRGVGEAERRLFGTMRHGELLCGRVAERQQRLVIEDLQHSDVPGSDVLRGAGATSYAGFPLVAGGRLIGTVAFVSARLTHFRDGEIQTIQTVCDHVATALERARLQRELAASERRLAIEVEDLRRLHELSFKLAEISEVHAVLDETLRVAAVLVSSETGTVQVREDDASLSMVAFIGFDDAFARRFHSVGGGDATTCVTALTHRKRVIVEDVTCDPVYADFAKDVEQYKVRGAVSTPLLDSAGEVSAMFTLYWREAHQPSERELRLLDLCAGIAARHLERNAAADAVRIRDERFQAAEQAASGLVYDWDVEANRLWRSNGMIRLTGWLPHEIAPTTEAWFALWHPDDRKKFEAQLPDRFIAADGSYSAEYRIRHKDGHWVWVWDRGRAERAHDGRLLRQIGAIIDISERKQREEQVFLLMKEVNHRAKNMLGLVQSIARQTAATDPAEFVRRFGERIQALSANQDLLVNNAWTGVDIHDLVRAQLALFKDLIGSRIAINGPSLRFTPAAAQAIGLALHELATNAGKYGALSDEHGRVDVRWHIDASRLVFSWSECDGPPVKPPSRKGFGSTVINSLAKMSVYGEVDIAFDPPGFSWKLTCPADKAIEVGKGSAS